MSLYPASDLPTFCDVLVCGGGINGCGIARDLAGRGLKVVLCEQDDLAAHTSSASTKLIHGGLRYLEYFEFALVHKALAEREVLLKSAPHIMWPMRFVMPHHVGMRPLWMIRTGLFIYDHMARRKMLPASRAVDLRRHLAGNPLKPLYTKGFEYSDGWVDDARLVVLNAVDAAERGATIVTRTRCTQASRKASGWQVRLQRGNGTPHVLGAHALVNATGPWAGQFLREQIALPSAKSLRLVKGSHIVVAKLFDHNHAYIFQNPDQRIVFAIPYEGEFTLIGTTEVEHHGEAGTVSIDATETAYLCEQVSRYFARPVSPADVVWSYSGVRPLIDDEAASATAVTRDYSLELNAEGAPLLTAWGGKLTTYRKLAEQAADVLCSQGPFNGRDRKAWTQGALLPGGDLGDWLANRGQLGDADALEQPETAFARFVKTFASVYPRLPTALVYRLARCYGTRAELVLSAGTLGTEIAPAVYEAELNYLRQHEWACTAEDVLWRRTKLGLHLNAEQRAQVQAWWSATDQRSQA